MKILAVDSSAKSASVAILDNEKVLGEFYLNIGFTHSQTLVPMIKDLLDTAKIAVDDIDLFAVSNGPGSFTGLRIGASVIKGLAFKNNTPCVAVSTLESIAYNLINSDCIASAVMDARCGQVYNADFEIKNGQMKRLSPDRTITIDNLHGELGHYDKKIIFVGDGADLCYNVNDLKENIFIADNNFRFQTAKNVAAIARLKFLSDEWLAPSSLVPNYLRPII
ncbi:MAG: tRNA (adenosine(37)-N6)-threonylcarbamoyltransferase complex dimerization subunit type 1 TsaB [Clostridia bacterium]|nr:tRNA (adenosine(37)-N6)-threonylcarbamoyltransferase complex dimerization subunit type 1 TsaB [Clostridia bacterium]